jgi:ATP adenylyltransferase
MPEQIWAPWRLEYIERPAEGSPGSCIFVDLPNENDDEKNLILFRGKTAFVMLNRYPYTSGHLMVAPYRHTANLSELGDDELLEISQLIVRCTEWIGSVYRPQGFNIGVNLGEAAGAGIPTHVHWHIVPRWAGDTNYMTVVGEVRVVPQSLEESYARLRAAIQPA